MVGCKRQLTEAWVNWVKATTPIFFCALCIYIWDLPAVLQACNKIKDDTTHNKLNLDVCNAHVCERNTDQKVSLLSLGVTLNNYCLWPNCRAHLFFFFFLHPSFKYPYPWYSKCEANFVPAKPPGRNVLMPALSFHHLTFLSEGPSSSIPFILSSCQSIRKKGEMGWDGVDSLSVNRLKWFFKLEWPASLNLRCNLEWQVH